MIFYLSAGWKQLKLKMVSAVANGYENTVSLIVFIDPVSLVVQHLIRKIETVVRFMQY